MIKAIIFDFDGVLVDTFDINISLCKELKMDFTLEDFKDHHDGNVYEKPKLNFTNIELFLKIYAERISRDNLFPLQSELKKLSKKYKMFVVSSNMEPVISKCFSIEKDGFLFEKIYGREAENSKIKKFKMLFKDYGLFPEECIYVTDTLGDLVEANKVNVRTIAVTWGYHDEMRLRKGEPTKIVHNFNELSSTVESIS